MRIPLTAGALLALMLGTASGAGARAASLPAPQSTDTIVAIERGARLSLRNHSGDVIVRTWGRAAVRVRAEHDERARIAIERSGRLLRVRADARAGRADDVDYRLDVPSWLAIELEGQEIDVDLEGVQSRVEVETVRGDIRVARAGGPILLRSVEGEIELDRVRGPVDVRGVNDDIRVTRASGEIDAETVQGDIELGGVEARRVRATTVQGDIAYRGALHDGGSYRFSTHQGDVSVAVPEDADATIAVATYNGEFEAAFPVRLAEYRRGRSFSVVLGGGGAHVEIEAFQGTVRLSRPD